MVSLVWLILKLCGVCSFSWLPIFIDCVLISIMIFFRENSHKIMLCITMGGALFSFFKCFFGLAISGWWILVFPFVFAIAAIVPGGFTLLNLLFEHLGFITLPTWGLIVCIVIDTVILLFTILDWAAEYKQMNSK